MLVKNHIGDTYKLPHFYWLSLIISCSFSIFVCLMNNIFIPRTEENWELIYMLNGIVSIVFNFLILYLNHLVEKYDGILDIQIKDGFFTLTCMVKTKEDDSDAKKEIQ